MNTPAIPTNIKEQALSFAESLSAAVEKRAVTNKEQDAEMLMIIQRSSEFLKEYKNTRLEFTRKVDALKSELMQPEKAILACIEAATEKRNAFANKAYEVIKIDQYKEALQREARAKVIEWAVADSRNNTPRLYVCADDLVSEPTEAALKPVYKSWLNDPKTNQELFALYEKAYADNNISKEVQAGSSLAKIAQASTQQQLSLKPKGAKEKVSVSFESVDAMKRVFGQLFKDLGADVLTDKRLKFLTKYAEGLPDQVLAEIESKGGLVVKKSLATTARK